MARDASRGIWVAAAALAVLATILVAVDYQLDASIGRTVQNQRTHVEDLTSMRRDARKAYVLVLEGWADEAGRDGDPHRGAAEYVASALRKQERLETLPAICPQEQELLRSFRNVTRAWASAIFATPSTRPTHDEATALRKHVDDVDVAIEQLLTVDTRAATSMDGHAAGIAQRRTAIQVVFLVGSIIILLLSGVWWRRAAKAEERAGAAEAERKRTAAEAEVRSTFFANMSHELRTPLVAIRGFCTNIETLSREPAVTALAQKIGSEAGDLLGIINNVLDAAKLQAAKVDVLLEPISVLLVLEKCAGRCQGLLGQKELELRVECPEDIPDIMADFVKLQQVILNLIGNAVKFTDRGRITLSASRNDGTGVVAIQVADTGVGIPESAIPHIWEPFRQADGSIQRRFGGTGLGLSIVHGLVQLMQGTVCVESKVGVGTAFTVSLPMAEPSRAATAAAGAASPTSSGPETGERVLG